MLDWDLSDIKDYENVCFTQTPEGREMKCVTETLIFATMTIGMGQITEKNYEEFATRILIKQALNGAYMYRQNKPYYVGFEDVKAHIGLSTNASSITKAKFLKNVKARATKGEIEKEFSGAIDFAPLLKYLGVK